VGDGLGVRVGVISVGAEVELGMGVSEAGVVVRSTKATACFSAEELQPTNIPALRMMAKLHNCISRLMNIVLPLRVGQSVDIAQIKEIIRYFV
jgi:hypothetical protein